MAISELVRPDRMKISQRATVQRPAKLFSGKPVRKGATDVRMGREGPKNSEELGGTQRSVVLRGQRMKRNEREEGRRGKVTVRKG